MSPRSTRSLMLLAFWFAVPLVVLACIAVGALWLRHTAELAPAALVVSEQTTYFVTPMRADGTVDLASHYAPGHDSLDAWDDALAHAPPRGSFSSGPGPDENWPAYCARGQPTPPQDGQARVSEQALAALELAAAGDWPEMTQMLRVQLQMIDRRSAESDLRTSVLRDPRDVIRLSRAVGCQCGRDAHHAPEQATRRVQLLARLAESLTRVPDGLAQVSATAFAREALDCAKVLESGPHRALLGSLVLDPPAQRDTRAWFVEAQRLRVLDAVLDVFYRSQPRSHIDVNVLLRTLNAGYDAARLGKTDFGQQMRDSGLRMKLAEFNPLKSAAEIRTLRSEFLASALLMIQEVPDITRYDAERLGQQQQLVRLVDSVRGGAQP